MQDDTVAHKMYAARTKHIGCPWTENPCTCTRPGIPFTLHSVCFDTQFKVAVVKEIMWS